MTAKLRKRSRTSEEIKMKKYIDPKEIIINGTPLSEIIENHEKWLIEEEGGATKRRSKILLPEAPHRTGGSVKKIPSIRGKSA